MRKYRLAMLCLGPGEGPECHAYHYAPFMDDCKPSVLHEHYPAIHYWFTDCLHTDEFANIRKVDGFEIVKIWDLHSVKRCERFADLFDRKPQVCKTVEETLTDVDAAFLTDGSGDGSSHLEVAGPVLEKGIPAFIDKPFAREYKHAQAIVDIARKQKTPFFSASILAHVDEIKFFHSRWHEIPPPGLGIVKGVGPSLGALIHGLSLAQGTFGTGVDWVECMGSPPARALSLARSDIYGHGPLTPGHLPFEVVMLHYVSGLVVMVVNTLYDNFDYFSCEVWGKCPRRNPPPRMYLRSGDIGARAFLSGTHNIVCLFKQMLDTGEPPVPYEVPLELIAIVEAARKAQATRKRVYLKEIQEADSGE